VFHNIPIELRQLPQWIVWRLEIKENGKPSKVPYSLKTMRKASVTEPNDWCSFANIQYFSYNSHIPVEPTIPIEVTGFTGIGFVFTDSDDFSGIDLDDTHGDNEALDRQIKIYEAFNSYSETSQSGMGAHIIVKGKVASGRRRAGIEIYSTERYFAMTGKVIENHFQIHDRQELLKILWDELRPNPQAHIYGENQEQKQTDDEILLAAGSAANSDKFNALMVGDWQSLNYSSQSEADFAFVDIVAFYTQNKAQIGRIFKRSVLGQQPKDNYKHRADRSAYVNYMVEKSFDRQIPMVDIDDLQAQLKEALEASKKLKPVAEVIENLQPASSKLPLKPHPESDNSEMVASSQPKSSLHMLDDPSRGWPPGLLGDIAEYIYNSSPTPVYEIAIAGAIGLLAGIIGRAYNISRMGLNQYVILLANTGTGKEAMASGIADIMNIVCKTIPAAAEFRGPGQIVSAPGLHKVFEKTPSIFSIVSEFGLKLSQFNNQFNPNSQGIKAILLELYNKSGHGKILDTAAYSDRAKNLSVITAPAFTLIGESTPTAFYENLDENSIKYGVVPRFMIIEYEGPNVYYNKVEEKILPTLDLIEKISFLCSTALSAQATNSVKDVMFDFQSQKVMDEFSRYCTDQINGAHTQIIGDLWSRAHVKAMKLAALITIGCDPINPVINVGIAESSRDFIIAEVMHIIKKFDDDNIGLSISGASETRQQNEFVRIVKEYSSRTFKDWKVYGVDERMFADGVIQMSALQRRLIGLPAFNKDRLGSTAAIKRTLQTFLEADDLREISKQQMMLRYGKAGRAVCVSNPARFSWKPGEA
jgi:hypothetical protein